MKHLPKLKVPVPILSWISPSTVPGHVQEMEAQTMRMCTHFNEKAKGMVMMPILAYKEGHLWMVGHCCIKSLAQRGCNLDKTSSSTARQTRLMLAH